MKSFSQYWDTLKKDNPPLNDETMMMKISVKSFKDELNKAFLFGFGSSLSKSERTDDFLDTLLKKFSNK